MDKRSWLDLYGTRYPEFNHHPQYLAAQLERAFLVIWGIASRNPNFSWDLYTRPFPDVQVQQDSYGTWYADMPLNIDGDPVRIIQLPDQAEGIRRITATKDPLSLLFVPLSREAWTSLSGLDVWKVAKYTPYAVMNGRVEFAKQPPVKAVTLHIVRGFLDYEDTENVEVPAGYEEQFEQMVAALIYGTPPTDKSNR